MTSEKDIGKDIWPLERDFMERPDRLKYVRKLVKPDGCVFCRAAASQPAFESLLLRKTSHSMIVMNKYPYNSGHLMALPLAHKGRIEELTDAEYLDLSQELRRAVRVLEAVYKPGGFNIGMNHGDVAGAGIPAHLHWHVIPRWLGDTNFFPLIAETKVLPETIEQSFAKVAAEFARTA